MKRRYFPELSVAVLGLAAIMVLPGRADDSFTLEIAPGQASFIKWPGLEFSLIVFLPEDFEPGKKWPVMFWYHGTNGDPTLDVIRNHTDRRNWVVVAMAYRVPGQFEYSPKTLQEEMAVYQAVRAALAKQIPIDESRVYMGGFSKGGWMSSLFIEKDPALAGAAIMGAGVFDRPAEGKPRAFKSRKSIFVGIGEQDPNLAMGHRARRHFEDLGAKVIDETWPELGHEMPDESEFFRQWLRMEGAPKPGESDPTGSGQGPNPVRLEAEQWYKSEVKRIGELDGSVNRYFALKHLATSPYAIGLGQDPLEAVRASFAEGALPEELKSEIESERRFQEIFDAESADRLLETLVDAHKAYAKLAKELPDTHYGKRAGIAAERTLKLMQSVIQP